MTHFTEVSLLKLQYLYFYSSVNVLIVLL